MKHMMICCGAGVATSTVALKKLEAYLTAEGLLDKVRISQGTVAEAATRSDLDFIVSTSTAKVAVEVINALPLLTGIGTEKVFESVKAQILG
ncbi:PTS system, Lactose/Cellobiose specific IIB subunit [Sodalis glossinidius str. 'morsitans']|uniref:PTS system galactitol-specific IIB component n=1 Tax=Sodalis glossinidius (strain morsitans) TaxID=343509 RepID=Q2NS55_SODGM|nr:PTS sugar transporter subunit IIB [Sodalis glossinidius]BAE75020.1 putative PTS system galactitol-specific IIB component [Sodalis glossinidius str. 'morsitans']CRL45918.1 PTS system, Lactose/Cellobiose specific IIB subunit [Sodalis glossinidius str. 'morsitans']